MSAQSTLVRPARVVDLRGQRFNASLTVLVLALVLLTGSVWLLAVQAVVFGLGAFVGPQRTPYSLLFRRFIRPRLSPPAHWEDEAPPRFAQLVGFVFSVVGLVGLLVGLALLGEVAVAAALIAAFLNAAFGFCLGCETYLLGKRFLTR